MCTRDSPSEYMATWRPSPTSPRRYLSGTRASVKRRPACPAPRQPIMWGMSTISYPGVSVGTKNAVRRLSLGASGSVRVMR